MLVQVSVISREIIVGYSYKVEEAEIVNPVPTLVFIK